MNNINSGQKQSIANLVYREMNTEEDFWQCINLQKNVFHLPDTHVISPLFLKLIARKEPPIGISLGVFNLVDDKSEMLGFIIGFASFHEKSIHTVMLAVKPEHKNKIYGYKLLIKFKEEALAQNLKSMYCVFEPLETNLARLYMSMDGAVGIKYIEEKPGREADLSMDKLLIHWNISENIFKAPVKPDFRKIIEMYPTANYKYLPDSDKVLMEIPENYLWLKKENIKAAIEWREKTRIILSHYLNTKKYLVSNCFTGRIKNLRKSYYLLEKDEITSGNL